MRYAPRAPLLDYTVDDLVHARPDRATDIFGTGIAAVLICLCFALLPRAGRRRLRQAVIFVGLGWVVELASGLFDPRSGAHKALGATATFLLISASARALVLLGVDVIAARRGARQIPSIFRDVTQAVAYVFVALLTLRAVGVEPGSILTTSALLTAVIGLALQDTLGNMVSGLALQLEHPYEVGDWIELAGERPVVGRIIEINWRATSVLTNDLVEVIVPNSAIAKANVRNYSRPSRVSRRVVVVSAPYDVPPETVRGTILAALPGALGVVDDPRPAVVTKTFADSGVEYQIFFFTDDFERRESIESGVRDRIWYAFQRAGISIPYPIRTVYAHTAGDDAEARRRAAEVDARARALSAVDFLSVLPDDARRRLAEAATRRLFAPGERIVRRGDTSRELYVVEQGTVVVEVASPGRGLEEVARLGPGDLFGELALMTGEPRSADVRADGACALFVVDHASLRPVLEEHPDLVERIGVVLADRQAALEAVSSSRARASAGGDSRRLISQIRDFFKLRT